VSILQSPGCAECISGMAIWKYPRYVHRIDSNIGRGQMILILKQLLASVVEAVAMSTDNKQRNHNDWEHAGIRKK